MHYKSLYFVVSILNLHTVHFGIFTSVYVITSRSVWKHTPKKTAVSQKRSNILLCYHAIFHQCSIGSRIAVFVRPYIFGSCLCIIAGCRCEPNGTLYFPSYFCTVSKNLAHNIMPYNSRKCGPILIILPLPHSQMNCRKSWNKICHRTSNLLPHYIPCESWVFNSATL